MERVRDDGDWSLMCPHECPNLDDCWGKEFEQLYQRYFLFIFRQNNRLYLDSNYFTIVLKLLFNKCTDTRLRSVTNVK